MDARTGSNDDLVEVGNYPDALSAESVRSCLEMEGIRAFVFGGEISRMQGLYTNAFGGVKVVVSREDESRALRILAESEIEDSPEVVGQADEITPDGIHCVFCHSPRVRSRETWNLPADPLHRFFVRLLGRASVTYCQDCKAVTRS